MENRRSLSASTLEGDRVRNMQGEDLGKVSEIMLDVHSGCISYVVLSHGGMLGMGDKLFAIPWSAVTLDMDNHEFVLDISLERLENAPGFDKTDWPDFSSEEWGRPIHDYYGSSYPSWFSTTTAGGMTSGSMSSGMTSATRPTGTTGTYGTPGETFGSDFERSSEFGTDALTDCDQPGLTEEERRLCREEGGRQAA